MRSLTQKVVLLVAVAALSGCTNYYRVTDPTTGRVYYTTELQKRGSGAVVIKDAKTGGEVSLQNSEIHKVNKESYESGKVTSGDVPGAKEPT
jgi:hypothetical protein